MDDPSTKLGKAVPILSPTWIGETTPGLEEDCRLGKFDFYQIVGVIAPGILLQVGLGLLFPEISSDFVAEPYLEIWVSGLSSPTLVGIWSRVTVTC